MPALRPFGLALAAVLLLLTGCDSSDDDTFDVTEYVGTYDGTVTIAVDGEDPSEAPVAIVVSASESARTVTLSIGTGGDAPLVIPGTFDANGAVFPIASAGSTLILRVDADGDISGSGTMPFFDVVVDVDADGRITRPSLTMTLDFEVIEGNGGTTPTGDTGRVTFSGTRSTS